MKLLKHLPQDLKPKAIEEAVVHFIEDTDIKADPRGFFDQTLQFIAGATFLGGQGNFWAVEEDGNIVAYLLASFTKDVDNTLCYWVSQSWVDQKYRGEKVVKEWWATIRDHAKRSLCRHIVVVGNRKPKAYSRFLGRGFHEYATLLKEDLED